ncbi:zinc metalloproteinase [Biomphalaria glabrata]|nr:zinc metalloproteinase [Biomphalaria glabrata]
MKIHVNNICDNECITYPLPLLVGEIEGNNQDGVLMVSTSGDPDGVIDWPVVEGAFKVLVRLQPGQNIIYFNYGQDSLIFRLTYEVPGFTHIVRPVYIICADDDGHFQGPEDVSCTPESAARRITLGAQIVQTLTAEKMNEHGFGRVTFQIETDSDHHPICHLFHSKLTLEEAYAMTGYQLWNYLGKELMMSPLFSHKSRSKFYCFLSFTRYHLPHDAEIPKTHSDILRHTKGHTALGGGGLALFGTGNLHTWSENLSTFNACLTNRKRIDRRKFMDDSAYREYYWANYATGLGASLHELGHTFDLAHTPSGIMARGFDDLHKVFTVQRRRKGRHHQRTERRQRYSSAGSSNSEVSRTSSTSSIDETSSLGSSSESSSVSNTISALTAVLKRQTDICYGSPSKQSLMPTEKSYTAPPPLVVSVESGFRQLPPPTTLTFSVKHYDGSETRQTITGGEIIKSAKIVKDVSCRAASSSSTSSASLSPTSSAPSMLPNSPEDPTSSSDVTLTSEVTVVDTGAHWYRSSAVVLLFHKWFNKANPNDQKKPPTLQGTKIKSLSGLRVIELRTDPEGAVFHHWEFLSPSPPVEFVLQKNNIPNLPDTGTVAILAEDNYGNILKKKIKVSDIV